MRKNCTKAFAAFLAGRSARPAQSIWTDGTTIYSYSTAILTKVPGLPNVAVLNDTRYSTTTTIHQTSLAVALGQEGWKWFEVSGFSRGTDFYDLLQATQNALASESTDLHWWLHHIKQYVSAPAHNVMPEHFPAPRLTSTRSA